LFSPPLALKSISSPAGNLRLISPNKAYSNLYPTGNISGSPKGGINLKEDPFSLKQRYNY